MTPTALVNSWNEWDPLEEVVVGIADNAYFEPVEPANQPKLRDAALAERLPFPVGPKQRRVLEAANAELAGLVSLLESHGVVVQRPQPHDFGKPVRTPNFEVGNQYCSTCPRDVMITFGTEILEATMSRRSRFFEYLPYRKLIYRYWQEDPGVLWHAAPKPSMRDEMYRDDFWRLSDEERQRTPTALKA